MGFLAGQSSFQAQPATGGAQFTAQNLQPSINTAQQNYQQQLQQANQVFGGQGQLAQQLAAQSQGQGPNIAQQQLQQATNQNIQQGAGMIASQKGLNPALAARLIQQQTAAANQNAAGQSGLMRAQQQLAAQSALANVYGQQGQLALQGGQLANQNLGINQGALEKQNADIVGAQNQANAINQKTAESNAGGLSKLTGGLLGGLTGALSTGLGDSVKSVLGGGSSGPSESDIDAGNFAEGGQATQPSNWTEGAKSLSDAFKNQGGEMHDYRSGGHVPGKAQYPGNNLKNDVVPAMLSKGEVVLPNTVTKSEDAPDKAKEFMAAIMEQKKPGPKGFSKIIELQHKMREMHGHLSDMHEMMRKVK